MLLRQLFYFFGTIYCRCAYYFPVVIYDFFFELVSISLLCRHNKCMQCYKDLVKIRSLILKRQTVPGKLGHTYRELSILMQYLD